jgi:hypothetical protein
MKEFKPGDRVRVKYEDHFAYGEITIVRENDCKVLFDGDFDLDYWYYSKEVIELIEEEKYDSVKTL